jgi:hypothetical protein
VKQEPCSPEPAEDPASLDMEDDMDPKDIELEYDDTEADVLVMDKHHGQQRPPVALPRSSYHWGGIKKVDVRLPNFEYFPRHLNADGRFLVSQLRHSHPAFFRKPGGKKKKDSLVTAKSTGGCFPARPAPTVEKAAKKKPRKEEWVRAVKTEPTDSARPKSVLTDAVGKSPATVSTVADQKTEEKRADVSAADSSDDEEERSEWPSLKEVTIRNMDVRVERLHKNIVSFKYKLYRDFAERQNRAAGQPPVVGNLPKKEENTTGEVEKKRGRKKKISADFSIRTEPDKDSTDDKMTCQKNTSVAELAPIINSTPQPAPILNSTSQLAPVINSAPQPAPVISSTSERKSRSSFDNATGQVKMISEPKEIVLVPDVVVASEPDDIVLVTEVAAPVLDRRKSAAKEPAVVVDVSDSSESEKEEEEEEEELAKDEVVENPFFTDSEDSDEGEEKQAKEKEKLVEMLYSLIKGDEMPASLVEKKDTSDLPPVHPPVAADLTTEPSSLGEGVKVKEAEKPVQTLVLGQDSSASQLPAPSSDPFDQLTSGITAVPVSAPEPGATDELRISEDKTGPVWQVSELVYLVFPLCIKI